MPDISKCSNEKCIMKKLCFRYTSTPNEIQQSYNPYVPKNNTETSFECDSFTPNRPKTY